MGVENQNKDKKFDIPNGKSIKKSTCVHDGGWNKIT